MNLKLLKLKKNKEVMQQPQEEAVPQQRPKIDDKTQEWIDNNKSWFGKVKGMTALLMIFITTL